ncbi:MAG: hypothetical protein K1X88_35610 [Nannocystaceae bacterium]|nr:hypothetical protein [Nannocystaceae bacterium]
MEPHADGGVLVRHDHADVLRSRYVFFASGWRWADPVVRSEPERDGIASGSIDVASLGVHARSQLGTPSPDAVALSWALQLDRALDDVPNSGLEFDVALRPSAWGGREPALTIDRDGKRLSIGAGKRGLVLELEGDAVGFVREPGAPQPGWARVRAVLLAGRVEAGARKATLRLRLPEGGTVRPSVAARLQTTSPQAWPQGLIAWDGWPVDVTTVGGLVGGSSERAGSHGRVRVRGDGFEFEDGTPVRFWGTNVVAYALFDGDAQDVARQARRIAALGYNLVRLHHHDSAWVEPNVFEPQSRRLRQASVEALDWWIKCLADAGVYVWLDLHVGRRFRATDGIGGFAELPDGDGRGFSYVDGRIETLMNDFASQYLVRTNRHTDRAIIDDPAVAFVLVTNENDVTHHFGQLMMPGAGRPVHEALLRERLAKITKAAGLPLERALQTWAPGPAKLALTELEHAWGTRQVAALHKLGVRVPIATTSVWGDESLYSVPSLQAGDVIDAHAYGAESALSSNPHHEPSFLAMAAMGHVLGRPHTLSEWNVPLPARDRHVAPMWVAAIAALQGWDAPVFYAHVQEALREPVSMSSFSGWVDPAAVALAPAAAILYRRGDVALARETIVLAPGADEVYGAARNPGTAAALRTGFERSRVVVALPDAPQLKWDRVASMPRDATVVADLDRDLLPREGTAVVSDTGEIRRDYAEGTLVIDTPRSQVASGWIGGATIALRDGWVALELPSATFALTSLDGAPLGESARILVTAVGQAQTGDAGRVPLRSEPVRGRFAIRSSRDLVAIPLPARAASANTDLSTRVPLRPRREGALQVFSLQAPIETHWYLLVPEQAAR